MLEDRTVVLIEAGKARFEKRKSEECKCRENCQSSEICFPSVR